MPRIHQLVHDVITKIAAGEVIERPASVVKELLENSVDAGSRRIDIEVEQGGTESIRIVDDGCGIYPDDLPLAFASHATSKLRDADELFSIRTLGFRGEALASIGGVAQVTLQSRPPELDCGAEVHCDGGRLEEVRPWNGSPGTRIEVKHLFFNTPVRRKFLRTTPTEMGHISEAFTRLALGTSGMGGDGRCLHLTLKHNNKPVYDVPATASLLDRVGLFFGADASNQLYRIESRRGDARVVGYVADPACDRGNARMQYVFLNGRCIRDRTISHALQEAYRGLLMTGRYAVAFLFLELPPDHVDVNVHPTKAEVRFRDANAVHHLVFTAIRDRLRAANLTARLQVPSTMLPPRPVVGGSLFAGEPSNEQGEVVPSGGPIFTPPINLPQLPPISQNPSQKDAPSIGETRERDRSPSPFPDTFGPPPPARTPENILPPAPGHAAPPPLSHVPLRSRAIQLYDTYLVVETLEGMLVIDQHALHERIMFEQLKRRLRDGTLETQRLLIPEPVELTAEQSARTLEHRDELATLGLHVEDFGGGTVLLSSYPAMLERRSPETILRTVVDHLMSQDRLPSPEVLLNDLLSLMACHSAVRAGDRLTPEQIDALIEQRHLVDDTHHCPHGRPTALLFSRQELERQFGRI